MHDVTHRHDLNVEACHSLRFKKIQETHCYLTVCEVENHHVESVNIGKSWTHMNTNGIDWIEPWYLKKSLLGKMPNNYGEIYPLSPLVNHTKSNN